MELKRSIREWSNLDLLIIAHRQSRRTIRLTLTDAKHDIALLGAENLRMARDIARLRRDLQEALVKSTGDPEEHCYAEQHSDQMFCSECCLTWDMNDPDPPKCKET